MQISMYLSVRRLKRWQSIWIPTDEDSVLTHKNIQMEKLEDGAVKVKLEVSREHTITCTDLADIFVNDENIKQFRL